MFCRKTSSVATLKATKEAYGGLDILVNNAGIAHNATHN